MTRPLDYKQILARDPVVTAMIERLTLEEREAVNRLPEHQLPYYRKLRRFGWTHTDALHRIWQYERLGFTLEGRQETDSNRGGAVRPKADALAQERAG